MNKTQTILFSGALLMVALSCCKPTEPQEPAPDMVIEQVADRAWVSEFDDEIPDLATARYAAQSDTMRLSFFGWSQDEDFRFHMQLPEDVSGIGRVVLEYTMCAWGNGPANWDMTTQIMVRHKQTDEWYELSRCITPYGGRFNSFWKRRYYLDVTPLLPLLQGDTEMKIFYCGWDATDKRAHAVTIGLHYFETASPYGQPFWQQKVYDSAIGGGNTGYRSWAYGTQAPEGLPKDTFSIEHPLRLGKRIITLQPGTRSIVLRSCFTGHGQDALTADGNGHFPSRPGYRPNNVAEFDYNEYTIILNGDTMPERGKVWELNGDNYSQAGTCKYDRCGWGPGKPCNVHYWLIRNIPASMTELTIDMDLLEYISKHTSTRVDSEAQFYVEVDAFGYR